MEFDSVVKELRVQQRRINAALVALVGTAEPTTPVSQTTHRVTPKAKRVSARVQKTTARKASPKFVMSPKVRDKISISQKARWAKNKATEAMLAHAANVAHNGNNETATATA